MVLKIFLSNLYFYFWSNRSSSLYFVFCAPHSVHIIISFCMYIAVCTSLFYKNNFIILKKNYFVVLIGNMWSIIIIFFSISISDRWVKEFLCALWIIKSTRWKASSLRLCASPSLPPSLPPVPQLSNKLHNSVGERVWRSLTLL